MDINMPGTDGIRASQTITQSVPEAQVIIMSVQSEADYLRRAMLAGARDFLMKPFSGDELVKAIRDVYRSRPVVAAPAPVVQQMAYDRSGRPQAVAPRQGKIVAVFSPKGGAGCTTVAANVAVALAEQGNSTLIVDGSLQFGDVAVMLNLKSITTLIDVIERIEELDQDLVSSVTVAHKSGLKALLAPPRPEMAELVSEGHMKKLLKLLQQMFEYVVVDTSSSLSDVTLAILDVADRIIVVTQQNLPTLKNVSRFFDLSDGLDYERNKVLLVVNHASNKLNISVKDIGDALKRPIFGVIPEDPLAYDAADQGRSLVVGPWQRRPAALALIELTRQLVDELSQDDADAEVGEAGGSRLSRLFGSR
jgi:pilus assembly protein CpaE